MLAKLILALAIIFGIWWAMGRYRRLESSKKKAFLIKAAIIGFLAITLIGALTGRMHWLGALFASLVAIGRFGFTFFLRAMPFLKLFGDRTGATSPTFKTDFLEVKISLSDGSISGKILTGPHSEREISSLSLAELQECASHYESRDKRSFYLMRVIIQRQGAGHQGHERFQNDANMAAQVGDLSIEEAKQILGLEGSPSKKDVVAAHRKLIQKLHPDRGGNDYLASRVNLAKDILLQQIGK